MEKRIKICAICHKEINELEQYIKLTDYVKGKIWVENFYHKDCYTNQIRGLNPQQKAMMALMARTAQVLGKAEKHLEE